MATVYKRYANGSRRQRYYIAYFDHTGKRQVRSARTTDKATAERIAAKLEADAALRRDGVIDAKLDAICRQSKRTIESHLADYEAKMVAESRAAQHIYSTLGNIRAIAELEGFRVAADIEADGVIHFAGTLRERGLSARTVQAYLTAIKGFTRWLTENQKLQRDPLVSVKKPNPKSDRRRERRMLLPEEWDWLRKSILAQRQERFGMDPQARMLLYAVAIQTGLRSAELRSLSPGRMYLGGKQPFIRCQAGSTKNRQNARQFIQPALACQLERHLAGNGAGGKAFPMPPNKDVSRMLRADLADARQAWLDDAGKNHRERAARAASDFLLEANHDGEVLDFHALRHTCGAWLAKEGAHPKTVQSVMRHSTITLTMDTYGHLFPGQEAEAVSRFPVMV